MSIKGLTDRGMRFPEIGRIRKGAPKPEDGKNPGADLDYFRVDFDLTDPDNVESERIFRGVYGEKPQRINVRFAFPAKNENWEAYREAYVAGGMIHRCDGASVIWQSGRGLTTVENGKPAISCDGTKPIRGDEFCKPVGRLKVIVPELKRAAYLTALTSSKHDIMLLDDELTTYERMQGSLIGIPFILKRRPVKISTPSGSAGQRVRRVKWLLSLEVDPAWVGMKIAEMEALARPSSPQLPAAIPVPGTPAVDTIEHAAEQVDDDDDGPEIAGSTEFWTAVYQKAKLSQEVGTAILEEAGGDYARAMTLLRERYVLREPAS